MSVPSDVTNDVTTTKGKRGMAPPPVLDNAEALHSDTKDKDRSSKKKLKEKDSAPEVPVGSKTSKRKSRLRSSAVHLQLY